MIPDFRSNMHWAALSSAQTAAELNSCNCRVLNLVSKSLDWCENVLKLWCYINFLSGTHTSRVVGTRLVVVALNVPQLTQASFLQKKNQTLQFFFKSVTLRWHRASVVCKIRVFTLHGDKNSNLNIKILR